MPPMKKMTIENDSSVTEFIFMGLTEKPELQLPLFVLILVNYTVTLMGNLTLVNLICLNSHLHTPMYFFLFNLSCIDFCYSCVFTPKMLMSFVLEKNSISFTGCMTQLFFFTFFVSSECYVAMAYDRYVAICQPLLYMVVMSPGICSLKMFGSYLMGFARAMAHTGCMIRLNFCDSIIINHYMCDIFPLLQLSCSSIFANELLSSALVTTVVVVSAIIILTSYALILLNIFHMPSKGWSKAMGTCGSHIITVGLFYGSGLLTYIKPTSAGTVDQGKFFSVFYTLVVPMMNPLIYSLRNKDVKLALKKTMKRISNKCGCLLSLRTKWL